jgi:CHRD domain
MTLIVTSITLISFVLVVVLAGETFLIHAQNQTKYAAKLIRKSVVPPVNTTAAGRAIIFIDNNWVWWTLNVTGTTDPTMAQIHMGKRGANGLIVSDMLNLLKSPKIENTTERTIITGNISASDLQGPMKGKTFADGLKPDHYKMYFADDVNNDGTFDIGAARVYAKVTVLCKQ